MQIIRQADGDGINIGDVQDFLVLVRLDGHTELTREGMPLPVVPADNGGDFYSRLLERSYVVMGAASGTDYSNFKRLGLFLWVLSSHFGID